MRSDQRILPLLVVFLVIVGSLFFALQQNDVDDELRAGSGQESALRGDGLESKKGTIPNSKRKLLQEESTSKTLPLDPEYAKNTKLDFGPAILCGDAQATFSLVDKKGAPLLSEQLSRVELWRKLGQYWIREHADLDAPHSKVVCAGYLGTGLEAGEYELGIDARSYGALWKKFVVAAGQRIEAQIEFPTWRRIIKLSFHDEAGRPVSRLPNQPMYRAQFYSLPRRPRPKPPQVLAPPPHYGSSVIFNETISFGSGGAGGSFGRRSRPSSYQTDHGLWYVPVFAGNPATLRLSFSRRFDGRSDLFLTSDFVGPEWESYAVKVPYSPTRKKRLEARPIGNVDNPGNRNSIAPVAKKEPDPADLDFFDKSTHRLIFLLNSSVPVRPVITGGSSRASHRFGTTRFDRAVKKSRGTWYADVFSASSDEVDYWYTDGALLRTQESEIHVKDLPAKKNICFLRETIVANRCFFESSMPTPTGRAWARGLRIGWSIDANGQYQQRINLPQGSSFLVRTALAVDGSKEALLPGDLILSFIGEGRAKQSRFQITLDEIQEKSLRDGALRLNPEAHGFMARAVDQDGAGLPWVEASLIPIDRLHAAISIRKRMGSWKKEKRTDRHFTNDRVTVPDVETQGDEITVEEDPEDNIAAIVALVDSFTENDLRKILTNGLYEEFQTDTERRFFAKNFTWYNTHQRLKSDRRGYLFDWQQTFEPGERFALFLWSNSRDHLKADAMVLFTATEGVTDLGAIRLPDYQ